MLMFKIQHIGLISVQRAGVERFGVRMYKRLGEIRGLTFLLFSFIIIESTYNIYYNLRMYINVNIYLFSLCICCHVKCILLTVKVCAKFAGSIAQRCLRIC